MRLYLLFFVEVRTSLLERKLVLEYSSLELNWQPHGGFGQ
ncbi:unnamed protein product [Schistosoma curassoni]|uniref:Uncharacterized protein n=1 Tax=Schistosoma curassoni TaxID=6186 RepID=A0A183KA31_9TREM|nr:unnamed protein product [Schistosoma curassoni]